MLVLVLALITGNFPEETISAFVFIVRKFSGKENEDAGAMKKQEFCLLLLFHLIICLYTLMITDSMTACYSVISGIGYFYHFASLFR